MSARVDLLLTLADDELILGWRNSEWTGIAPFLEEDVAFSSIAQNEIGHARALYELAARELGTDADALAFDRTAAWGLRLAVPAGTAVRFEPGVDREVELVPIGGRRVVPGLRTGTGGPLDGQP